MARSEELRRTAERYYADFRPAVEAGEEEPEAFARAGERSLRELEALEGAVQEIQRVAQERSEAALDRLRAANAAAQRNLIAVVVSLFLIGAALSYTTVRMVGELRSLYAREQQTNEKLARSEERFRALVKNSSDIISVFEADGTIIYHSPSHQRILGYRPEKLVGRNVFELPHIHPEDFGIQRNFFGRILASGPDELQTAEFRLRDVEGRYHVMEAVGANRLDDPLVHGIVINYRDVTERHQAEEKLRFQKALLESQTEASIDGILVVSEGGEILSYNRRFVEIWSVPEEVMDSRRDEDVLRFVVEKVEDPVGFRARVGYLYEHPEEESHEEIPLRDGRVLDRYSAPVRSADGVYYGRVWYFRDITGRKRAEEQLRRYAALIDLSYEPIFVWDLEEGIVEWNKGCERLYGYSKEEAAGRVSHRLLKTVHPITVDELKEALRRDGVWSGEVRHTTRGGREVIVESRHQLVESQGRRLVLETNRDITERKRIEEELARSLQSKTDFLADVSHELRTPLTMIRTNAEVGLHVARDCPHIEQLEQIAVGAVRMSRLVDDLLFLARSDSDSPPLEIKAVAVPLFLVELAGRAEALARERGAAFEASLCGEGWLRIDPARIEQAVLILVDNAAKYGSTGDPITLTAATAGGELYLRVEDRGPGIPAEDLPRVFDRFYRGKTARSDGRSGGGTGLGLAIARTIVEAHGGRMEAANRRGGGASMSIYLPVAQSLADTPEVRSPIGSA
ncbi:PAS domain S-box protein [Rubrobacter taiwanensis]|uniref:Sensor-like histidine kinase SenX3 n=1 Tax=Rubrobacter taiwanensis TaxID=185139 RepID=A0A4R1BFQ4_9ACTN|nr:PAS domain S-box protein [Rubrobacter taiwanensis]TCJ15999.1 PAS domain S-box protein [Rubrobacter taiwanensis]